MPIKLFTIPNIITLANLLCGVGGIILLYQGDLLYSSYLIFLALVLDYADGLVARLTNTYSEIGKQLDSLADMVSFGVLPALILMYYTREMDGALKFLPLLLVLSSALRLAKFNIDTRQTDGFRGVPTPANAMAIAALPLVFEFQSTFDFLQSQPIYFLLYTLVMAYLLISDWPMLSFKFKNLSWSENKLRFSFLGLALLEMLLFRFAALPILIFTYVLWSFIPSLKAKA